MYNMLLYNWKKIFETAEGNPLAIFIIFRMITTEHVPLNKYDKTYRYSNTNYKGDSFIVHPDILLYYAYKYEYAEIAQYLGLASMRPLADYKATGKLSLDLNLLEVDISLFEDNSLLHIDDEFQLHFKYEEVPKEKIH